MASKPLSVPTWATDANYTSGPAIGTPTKVAPAGAAQGFIPGARPGAQNFNYQDNLVGQWAQYLSDGALSGDHSIAGALAIGGQALTFADFTFTADSTTDIYAHTAHGLQTGDGPIRLLNSGGALPSGLLVGTDYYAVLVDADHFQLSITRADALVGFVVDILDNGTGTQTLLHQAGTTRSSDAVVSRNASVAGTLTAANAQVGGAAVNVASFVFTANSTTNTMDLGTAHGLQTGAGPVRVTNSGGALPAPLVAGTDYWVIRSNFIKVSLATSFANAVIGTAIDLTTSGSGTNTLVAGTSPTAAGSLTVHGRVVQAAQTTVVRHTINGQLGSSGNNEIAVPGTTAVGQGHYMQIENIVGRTLVAIRAYVADDGGTARLLIGVAKNDSLAFLGAPPTGLSDVSGTLSSPSAGSGVVEIVQKSGLALLFAPGVAYFVFCRISAGTGGRLEHIEYDWV